MEKTGEAIDRKDVLAEYIQMRGELSAEIDRRIADNGGEDMLISRMDLMYWVYFSRDAIRMYDTVIRALEGEKDVSLHLVSESIRQRKEQYRTLLHDVERLRKEIVERQAMLDAAEEQLSRSTKAIGVLEHELASRDAGNNDADHKQ